jgi:hypothetical protein
VTLFVFGRGVSMPWQASPVMEERLRFVARLLEGEPMSQMCREFGISRKTGSSLSRMLASIRVTVGLILRRRWRAGMRPSRLNR